MNHASALPAYLGKRLAAVFTVAALVIAGFAVGVSPAAAADTASISGTVVTVEKPQSGSTLGVSVSVRTETGGYVGAPVQTDAAGKYSVTGLPAGRYKISFDDGVHAIAWWGGKDTLGTASVLVLAAGKAATANVILETSGSITGTATLPAGTAIPGDGVSVVAYNEKYDVVKWAYVEPSGKYTLAGLPQGNYALEFSYQRASDNQFITKWWSGKNTFETSTRIAVKYSRVTNAAFVLPGDNSIPAAATGVISGTVLAKTTSAPQPNRMVEAHSGFNWFSAMTDINGKYVFPKLPAGSYTLEVGVAQGAAFAGQWYGGNALQSSAVPVTLAAGQTASSKNFSLPAAGSISGSLRSSDAPSVPITTGSVIVYDADGDGANSIFTNPDSNGMWTASGLAPGKYRVAFYATGYANNWWSAKTSLATATTITVTAGAVTSGIAATMAKASSISGTATFAAGTNTYVNAVAYNTAGEYVASTAFSTLGKTSATYTIGGLPAGSYRIGFSDYSGPFLDLYFGGATTLAAATSIPVMVGQAVTGKNITLGGGGSISGTVTNVAGEKLDGTGVPVWQKVGSTYEQYGLTTTDGVGAYSLSGLPTGTYKVGFSDYASSAGYPGETGLKYKNEYFNDVTTLAAATAITVTGTQAITGKNAVLAPSAGYMTLSAPQPTISGSATVGSTLTRATGTWGPAPVTTTTQWRRNGVAIAGATAATYVVAAADSGSVITVSVTGAKSGYISRPKSSLPTVLVANALTATPVPTISGTVARGKVLTAVTGTWAPAPVALGYQWKRAGVAIAGATAATYTLTAADVGTAITVAVTGRKSGYGSVAKTSAATANVVDVFTTAPVPTIKGAALRGTVLTAVPGTWAPAATTLKYQWNRAGVAIAGATAATYTLLPADRGSVITVTVKASRTGFATTSKVSAATAVVGDPFTATPVPTIAGTMLRGKVLTATSGTWAPAPVALAFQWNRAGVAIAGATTASYTLQALDVGKSITVTVTGSKTNFGTTAKVSAATPAILDKLASAPVATIGGTKTVGSTLTATPGDWAPAPVTLSYQWMRAGVAIAGATAPTYKVVAADVSAAITVKVTGTKSGFATTSTTSAAK